MDSTSLQYLTVAKKEAVSHKLLNFLFRLFVVVVVVVV
eukprot:gene2244-1404_t